MRLLALMLAMPACSVGIEDAQQSVETEAALGAPVWIHHETWDSGATPIYQTTHQIWGPFARDRGFDHAPFSGTVHHVAIGPYGAWNSVGLKVSPSVTGPVVCYAQVALKHPGVVPGAEKRPYAAAIEVIDQATFNYVTRQDVTLQVGAGWVLPTTPGWSTTKPVYVRAIIAGGAPPDRPLTLRDTDTAMDVDDIIVKCIPKPSTQELTNACSSKCNTQCTAGFRGGPTEGIGQCVASCTTKCVGRGHPF